MHRNINVYLVQEYVEAASVSGPESESSKRGERGEGRTHLPGGLSTPLKLLRKQLKIKPQQAAKTQPKTQTHPGFDASYLLRKDVIICQIQQVMTHAEKCEFGVYCQ